LKNKGEEMLANALGTVDTIKEYIFGLKNVKIKDSKLSIMRNEKDEIQVDFFISLTFKKR
jgi:hypothetical protein